jgi:hypothetical protein
VKRLFRHLFTVLSAVSLLLCVTTCVVWVRSYWISDFLHWYRPVVGREYGLINSRGQASFYRASWKPDSDDLSNSGKFENLRHDNPVGLEGRIAHESFMSGGYVYGPVMSFGIVSDWGGPKGIGRFEVMVPEWVLFAGLAVMPCIWVHRNRHELVHRRQRIGVCVRCGYDLRASPERCPECGTPARAAISAASSVQSTP